MGWIANFLQFLVFYFLITTMPLYAMKEFSASEAYAGLAASAIFYCALLFRLLYGFLINRFVRRTIVVISVLAAPLACAFYIPNNSLKLLYVDRLLHGIASAFSVTANMAMVQE